MTFIIRKPRAHREHRARRLSRPRARRESFSFESLEGRFLLSGIAPVIKPILVIETTNRQVVQETPAPVFPDPPAQVTTASLLPATAAARDDSFSLPAGDGKPSVHLDLLWPEAPDPSDVHLIVSDSTGNVRYDLPLAGVQGLHAELPMPSSNGNSTTVEVDLRIHPAGPESPSSGSYRVAIYWGREFGKVEPPQPQGLGMHPKPASGPTEATGLPAPAYPSITATRDLPSYSAFANANLGDPGGHPDSGGPPGSIGPPVFSPPPRIIESRPGPSSGPIVTTSAATSSSASSPASNSVQVPPSTNHGPGDGTNLLKGEGGQGSRPAAVGPLPLSGSTPDGGIFAYPYGTSRGVSDPFEATFTMAPAPEADGIEKASHEVSPRRSPSIPFDDEATPSIARPFDLDMSTAPAASGAASLPPFASLAEPGPPGASARAVASRSYQARPYQYGSARPRLSLEGVLIGSAWLFLGLVAPSCVARLTSWQDDRRWERRSPLGARKKMPRIDTEL